MCSWERSTMLALARGLVGMSRCSWEGGTVLALRRGFVGLSRCSWEGSTVLALVRGLIGLSRCSWKWSSILALVRGLVGLSRCSWKLSTILALVGLSRGCSLPQMTIGSHKNFITSGDHLEKITGKVFDRHLIFTFKIFDNEVPHVGVIVKLKVSFVLHNRCT